MAEARPEAEADKRIILVPSSNRRTRSNQQAAQGGEEGGGAVLVALDKGVDVAVRAEGHTKHRVAAGDGGPLAAEEECGAISEGEGAAVSRGMGEGEDGRGEGADGALTHTRRLEGRAEGGALSQGKGKAGGEETRVVGRRHGGGVGGRRCEGSEEGSDGGNHTGRGKDVDVVGVGDDHSAGAYQTGDRAQDRVQAKGEELCSQRVALASATARTDHSGVVAVTPDIQLRGGAVAGMDPRPESRETLSNNLQESSTVNGVERVGDIQREIDPITVLIEDSTNRVCRELDTRAAGDTNLGWPRGAVVLSSVRARGWRRRLEEGGKGWTILVSGDHRHSAREGRANGNRAEAAGGGISRLFITLLSKGNEAAAKEPRADRRR